MNTKFIAGIALVCAFFTACDDSTDSIGSSLIEGNKSVSIETASFDIASNSVKTDSVLSRNVTGYLGKVRDPETGAYITGDFMTQFNYINNNAIPPIDSLITYDANGKEVLGKKGTIKVDSCEIRLIYDNYYGDKRQSMKLTAYEMGQTMNENRLYYSNFDPIKEGFVRKDGIRQDKVYNLTDYNIPQSKRDSNAYLPFITVSLNGAYTSKDGKRFNNYGSYVLQSYYDHPEYFKNSYTFRNHVVPGFFFKMKSGLGNMATVTSSQLNIYYKYMIKKPYVVKTNGNAVTHYKDTVYNRVTIFWGTEEVLQSTTITNDKATIDELVADPSCTYLKSPSGVFTELTLPVEEIMKGHEQDSIVSAKVIVSRMNNKFGSKYDFAIPQNVLMVPVNALRSFFEKNTLHDNKVTYIASYKNVGGGASANNSYTFHNIAGLISAMYHSKDRSANWNKVALVPISLSTTTTTSAYNNKPQTVITKVSNDMSLTSTRLVKGTSHNSPIKVDVIYSRIK